MRNTCDAWSRCYQGPVKQTPWLQEQCQASGCLGQPHSDRHSSGSAIAICVEPRQPEGGSVPGWLLWRGIRVVGVAYTEHWLHVPRQAELRALPQQFESGCGVIGRLVSARIFFGNTSGRALIAFVEGVQLAEQLESSRWCIWLPKPCRCEEPWSPDAVRLSVWLPDSAEVR